MLSLGKRQFLTIVSVKLVVNPLNVTLCYYLDGFL